MFLRLSGTPPGDAWLVSNLGLVSLEQASAVALAARHIVAVELLVFIVVPEAPTRIVDRCRCQQSMDITTLHIQTIVLVASASGPIKV